MSDVLETHISNVWLPHVADTQGCNPFMTLLQQDILKAASDTVPGYPTLSLLAASGAKISRPIIILVHFGMLFQFLYPSRAPLGNYNNTTWS